MSIPPEIAKRSTLGNDLYWKVHDPEDGTIRWIGYDDTYWWEGPANTDGFRNIAGKVTGRTYRLCPDCGIVTITRL